MLCLNQLNTFETSKNYKHVNSNEIKDLFESYGYQFSKYSEAKVRRESKRGFQKHVMEFTTNYEHDGNMLRLLLTNSHDGSGSVKLNIGIFRMVCSNGLVIGKLFYESRFIHNERQVALLSSELEKLPMILERVIGMIKTWSSIQLSSDQVLSLQSKVVELRDLKDAITSADMIKPLRAADQGNDLYTVFNRAQEVLIRGGIQYGRNGKVRRLRAVKGAASIMRLNTELFNYASTLAA